jgi:hypothetical protein
MPLAFWLALSGVRPAIEEGDDDVSWVASFAGIAGGAIPLFCGWHLPASWGPFWSLGSEGIYVSAIAAGVANIALSLGARGYEAGYRVASLASGRGFTAPGFDPGPWQEAMNRQAEALEAGANYIAALEQERDRLKEALGRAALAARDFQEVLRFDGVRKAVLKVLHRDSHPGIPAIEARAFDARFQKASAVFAKIENGEM